MINFSIILPVRNGGSYVKDCVHSILSQSIRDFQLHILDNNSSDGTTEWIKSLNDNRIVTYFSDKDLSMVENWARIAAIPKNEYMTIIGHDDLLLPNYLESMSDLIKRHPGASLYQSHFNYIDHKGAIIRVSQKMPESIDVAAFFRGEVLQQIDSMGTGYMFKSSVYDKLGGIPVDFPNLIFADYALWMQLITTSYLAVCADVCFEYRIHNSVSKKTDGENYAEAFGKYIEYLIELSESNPELKSELEKYGADFIMYFCESLSHRILKSNERNRKRTVGEHVRNCRKYASLVAPQMSFRPLRKPKILAALVIDQSRLSRYLFRKLKGL